MAVMSMSMSMAWLLHWQWDTTMKWSTTTKAGLGVSRRGLELRSYSSWPASLWSTQWKNYSTEYDTHTITTIRIDRRHEGVASKRGPTPMAKRALPHSTCRW